jgi:hypothetical protein
MPPPPIPLLPLLALGLALALALLPGLAIAQTTIIPWGNNWRFMDQQTFPDAGWAATNFADSSWTICA